MISDELKQQILELRKQGKSYNEICSMLGTAKSSVSNICKNKNLGIDTIVEPISSELLEKAQKLYNDTGSVLKVSKQLNISYQRLLRHITLKSRIKKPKAECIADWRRKVKIKLVQYKGGKCECCGYCKCIEALEFHHLDPKTKEFQISGCCKSFDILKMEVNKCILVCSNCHKEIHAGIRKI